MLASFKILRFLNSVAVTILPANLVPEHLFQGFNDLGHVELHTFHIFAREVQDRAKAPIVLQGGQAGG